MGASIRCSNSPMDVLLIKKISMTVSILDEKGFHTANRVIRGS